MLQLLNYFLLQILLHLQLRKLKIYFPLFLLYVFAFSWEIASLRWFLYDLIILLHYHFKFITLHVILCEHGRYPGDRLYILCALTEARVPKTEIISPILSKTPSTHLFTFCQLRLLLVQLTPQLFGLGFYFLDAFFLLKQFIDIPHELCLIGFWFFVFQMDFIRDPLPVNFSFYLRGNILLIE